MSVVIDGLHAVGHYRALIVCLTPDRAVADGVLDGKLRRVSDPSAPAGTHPLILMFGHHNDVRPSFKPATTGGSYDEFVCAVPYVQRPMPRTDDPAVWACMPRLFLNSLWYVLLGWPYGYPKVLANTRNAAGGYSVTARSGDRALVVAEWQVTGDVMPFYQFPTAAAIAPYFRQPFLQPFLTPFSIASIMQFHLDDAEVQSATADYQVGAGSVPGLPAIAGHVGSAALQLPGAFWLSVPWTLSRPYVGHLPSTLARQLA